jgi:hypothetical protein
MYSRNMGWYLNKMVKRDGQKVRLESESLQECSHKFKPTPLPKYYKNRPALPRPNALEVSSQSKRVSCDDTGVRQ